MIEAEVISRLRSFIAREADVVEETLIREDMDLFREGVMDSLGAVSLIAFCHDTFGCDLGGDDFSEDDIRTVRGLARFICTKIADD